jgi:hypothetical protein
MRANTQNGISSNIKSKVDQKEYVISTAKHPSGVWETAIFGKNIFGFANILKPLRVKTSRSFEEAEKEHSWCEDAFEKLSKEKWQNTSGKKIFYTTS